jgi:hypothetical protein
MLGVPAETLVSPNDRVTEEVIDLVGRNGYPPNEIRRYFDEGALWFGLNVNASLSSVCFVYPN